MASAEERGSIEHVFTRAEHEGNARFKPLCRVSARHRATEVTNRQQRRDRGIIIRHRTLSCPIMA